MERIDEVYKWILQIGLVAIRNSALSGDLARCLAEAEHIHNVPSLLGEHNLERHLYYLNAEKTAYIDWVKSTDSSDLFEEMNSHYVPLWSELAMLLDTTKPE